MIRRAVTALLFLILIAANALAQEPVSSEVRVRELLTLMRAGDIGLQAIDGMITGMKRAMPGTPEEFWTAFRKKIKPEELVDMLVPVYQRNLSDADIEELIRFYSSPTGKRFVEKQPVILNESMAAGRRWGEVLAQRAIEDLQKNKP